MRVALEKERGERSTARSDVGRQVSSGQDEGAYVPVSGVEEPTGLAGEASHTTPQQDYSRVQRSAQVQHYSLRGLRTHDGYIEDGTMKSECSNCMASGDAC